MNLYEVRKKAIADVTKGSNPDPGTDLSMQFDGSDMPAIDPRQPQPDPLDAEAEAPAPQDETEPSDYEPQPRDNSPEYDAPPVGVPDRPGEGDAYKRSMNRKYIGPGDPGDGPP